MKKFILFVTAYGAASTGYWIWLQMEHVHRSKTTGEQIADVVQQFALGPINNLYLLDLFPWEYFIESAIIISLLFLICVYRMRKLWYAVGVVWFYSSLQYGFYLSHMG